MSTNYYLKRIPTEEEIENCKKCLDERRLESFDFFCRDFEIGKDDSVEYWFNKMTEKIHIGKYTDGFRFLFRSHKELYSEDLASVFQFIGERVGNLWKLINEYGEEVDIKDFKDMVKESIKTGIDSAEYERKHPEAYHGWGGPKEVVSFDKSRWWDVDFF